jgi:hypothetical protein
MKKIFLIFGLLMLGNNYAQDMDKTRALNLIKTNAKRFHLNLNVDESPIITNAYTDEQTGLSFVYFQQTYKGIKVYNQIQTATFRNDILQYNSGIFISDIASKVPSSIPQITALNAVKNAANNLQINSIDNPSEIDNQFATNKEIVFSKSNISKRNIKAALLWKIDIKDNTIHLVWRISLSPLNTSDNWNIFVDAATGNIIDKYNETVSEAFDFHHIDNLPIISVDAKKINLIKEEESPIPPQPTTTNAVYNVVRYPYENRFAAGVALETNPWLKAGAGNNAITNGWHFDGTTNYDITRGNNVFAYDDSLNIDAPGRWVTSTTSLPSLNFNFTPDFSQQPYTTANRNFATTNLFYWNNLMHDVSYQYGFTEAAGNFQKDNLGRGGFGNDFVLAEAQDGGGVNNANFWANPDGDTAIMQMYLFTGALNLKILSPSDITGSYSAKEGAFSTANLLKNVGPKTGQIIYYNDNASGTLHTACSTAVNSLTGKIALIKYAQQTGCTFVQRVKNAQNAGAIGVIVIYNTNKPITMGGTDNTITIPAVMIALSDGNKIETQLALNNTVNATLQAGVQFDGDIDNGVVTHEYTHGISIRLTGGAANSSCLSNAEQAGEGWSDYMALMMTTNWSTATINDGIIARPIGVYAFNQVPTGYGIRTYPYTTDMSINLHTYSDMAVYGEVHYIGEIWCSTIWDMTWAIIQQENIITPNLYNAAGAGGNVIALNLVMMGLKLQPCSPGFLDSRDAILAADDLLYNGKHKCVIWNAFARRGMGYSAKQGASTSTTDQTVAFDVPMAVTFGKQNAFKTVASTSQTSFNLKATCQCKSPTNNYKIKAIIPAGFAYLSSTGGVKNADSVIFSNINFQKTFQTDSVTLSLTASSTGCALDSVVNDNRDTKTIGGFVNANISGNNGWSTTTQYAYSPTTAWQAADVDVQTEQTLTSNLFTPTGLSLLSFWHLYDFEGGFDGGLIELSTNNGTSWQAISNNFLQNGYNTTLDASAPLANQRAFSGTITSFQNSIADVTPFKNNLIKLRFRTGTDVGNSGMGTLKGWIVDDITVTNGCGAFVKFYVYDSANNLLDSSSVPVYITPKILPVKYTSFAAKSSGKMSLLKWTIAEQINVKQYEIERSMDGVIWNGIGLVNATNNFDYSYNDENPNDGINYYRIKAVDFTGSFNVSETRQVSFSSLKGFISIVPNPSKTDTKIYLPKNFNANSILVYDVRGKVIFEKTVELANTFITLNTSDFKQGIYLVNVLNKDGEVLSDKLIITK